MNETPTPEQRAIAVRVSQGAPLNESMGDDVRALIAAGYMHVTPTFKQGEVCPYRLTEKGAALIRSDHE